MDINIIYKSHIISLFTDTFEKINNKYPKEKFNWVEFSNSFNILLKTLSDQNISENDFIKYYYYFTLLYLNYTNYLVYLGHPDINNSNLEKIIKKIKTSQSITKNLFKFISNENIKHIVKLNNIFILNKIRKNKLTNENINGLVEKYIWEIKQFDKIYELENNMYKKILNLIIFRQILCKNNNYKSYHNFYLEKILNLNFNGLPNDILLDFDFFMDQLPKMRKILNVSVGNINLNTKMNNKNINIEIYEVINFILKKQKIFYIYTSNESTIIIKNKKNDGDIKININEDYDIEFNQLQTNYNYLCHNLVQFKEFGFLKKSFNFFQINLNDKILYDLSSLLDFIHYLTISIKTMINIPTNLYECIYPIDYNNYYFETFCYFIEFIKPQINLNYHYNKFIYDIVKFLYIYSYYDYYFYYSDSLVNVIINNINHKNDIFVDFIKNLKTVLKLPKEFFPYPPFFNNEFDINSIIYYNFEMPSYFKLFDLINAIGYVFDETKYQENNKTDFVEILLENIFIENKNTFINSISHSISLNKDLINQSDSIIDSNIDSNIYSNTTSSVDFEKLSTNTKIKNEIESNLDSEIINNLSKKNIKQISKSNTYIELNLNSANTEYIFDTEK